MSLHRHLRFVAAVAFLLFNSVACSNPDPNPNSGESHDTLQGSEASANGDSHDEHGEHEEGEEGVVELTPEAAARIEIHTALIEYRPLAAQLTTTGRVDFDQTRLAHVSPRISGRVHRVSAVLGQQIRSGQQLAEIDSIELGQAKAVYLRAKAKEELARKSFDRAQGLFADRIASEQEVLESEAMLREATADLRAAEETLHLYGLSQARINTLSYEDRKASIYPLRAPFGGTVVERHATLGELVTPERNLFTLADLSRVWIWIDVYQRDLSGVHLDDQARAQVDAFPGEIFEGKVSYLSAQVDADTRTVRARIDLANSDGKLRPGMFVKVELVDPHSKESNASLPKSLVVPEEAVVRDGDEFLVFVVTGEHRFERREVRLGRKAGGFVELFPAHDLEAIKAGDTVVTEGAFLLKSAVSKDSLGGGHEH